MNNQRILWFQDGVKLKCPQHMWATIDGLNQQLIKLSGHPRFDHVMVDPIKPSEHLFDMLNLDEFSSIIDLSGFFGETVRRRVEDSKVIDNFHLSRIRVISSPRLDGIGFLLSVAPDKISTSFDLSHPLIIDDVSWSGRTIIEAANSLQIDLSQTTCGFIAVNSGDFGEGKPGAMRLLENLGTKVVSGITVQTPRDDGFHLADFFNINFSTDQDDFIDAIITIQELRERALSADDQEKKFIEAQIKDLLLTERKRFFPNALSTEEMRHLQDEGKLIIRAGINRDSFFDTNPPNWLLPSFSRRVISTMLRENKKELITNLCDFRDILNPDWELSTETREGKERMRSILQKGGKERF